MNTNTTTNTTTLFSNSRQKAASAAGALVLTISMLVGINLLATQNVAEQQMAAATAATPAAKS